MLSFKALKLKLRQLSIRYCLVLIPLSGILVLVTLSILLDLSSDNKVTNFTEQKLAKFKAHKFLRKCRDWHDYEQIYKDRERVGPGENGAAVRLTNETEIALNDKLYKETGFAVVVSDKISVNRSIQDTRHADCQKYLYPEELPSTSIIIIFHNEIFSVLKRTIHSVVNRTPPELLHEIILVNDCSTKEELYKPLQDYVKENFRSTTIRIKNLKERKGLIVTRLEGAEIATGEVLVFFDSHIEVNINWLPPLLAPIKANRRLATMPSIDNFEPDTFENIQLLVIGDRGAIDWELIYRRFMRTIPDGVNPLKPYPNPIMLGCGFAIDRKFFMEELDGYDREYKIWNAENYELSFKLWLCADGLYEVPCSRISHTFRMYNPSRNNIKEDYLTRNFKRLAEVWLDDYKEVVYSRSPEKFAKVDAGDLSRPKAVRDRLKCKNFQYFLDNIAPDILLRYPTTKETPVFASGQIKSVVYENICIDLLNGSEFDPIGLYNCEEVDDPKKIPQSQFFRLNFMKNIVVGHMELCLDSYKLATPQCHYAESGNQYWKYDYENHMLINSYDVGNQCLTANFSGQSIYMKECDLEDGDQKWKFTYENETALNDWNNIYTYKKFVFGDKELNWDSLMPLKYDEECPFVA
ncbi:unnamed protein product [Chironomus riparius]|uniref:Polypeptide N-acetylgalactosaminyltransferase n=1 Tax=Chironomus riparius TaxID=315576 RepID=A0A9N9S420_9DIPT|nr:unnamed protein product [Chironomus riparius]